MIGRLILKTALMSLFVILVAGSASATIGHSSYFNYPEFRVVSDVERGKAADFELSFSSIIWIDSTERRGTGRVRLTDTTDTTMRVTVSVLNNEDTLSSNTITVELSDDSVQVLRFSAMIPNSDTACVVADIEQAGFTERCPRYFVWNGDEMELRLGNPRFARRIPEGGVMFSMPTPTRVNTRPEWDTPEEKAEAINARGKRHTDSLHMLEGRRVAVEDPEWRRMIETQEEPFGPVKDINAYHKQWRDSIQSLPPDHTWRICFDLRDSVSKAVVESALGKGVPSGQAGFFEYQVTQEQFDELDVGDNNIKWRVMEDRPDQDTQSSDSAQGDR